jgi:hypothetical protein
LLAAYKYQQGPYTVNALKYGPSPSTGPLKPYKAKKNEKWELIAFLLNNFFQIR